MASPLSEGIEAFAAVAELSARRGNGAESASVTEVDPVDELDEPIG